MPSLPPGIVINDPQNVEHVLKNNDVFIKGDFFKLRSWDLFGRSRKVIRLENRSIDQDVFQAME